MKKRNLIVEVIPSLNRGVVITAFPAGHPVTFCVLHHKLSSAVQFTMNTSTKLFSNGSIKFNMYRNLSKSLFCQKLLNLSSTEDDKNDIRCAFTSLNELGKTNIDWMTCEDHQFITDPEYVFPNYLKVKGWKLKNCDEDYNFYFIERACFNVNTNKLVVRTAGLELYNSNGMNTLENILQEEKIQF